jgi:hypothetical protein
MLQPCSDHVVSLEIHLCHCRWITHTVPRPCRHEPLWKQVLKATKHSRDTVRYVSTQRSTIETVRYVSTHHSTIGTVRYVPTHRSTIGTVQDVSTHRSTIGTVRYVSTTRSTMETQCGMCTLKYGRLWTDCERSTDRPDLHQQVRCQQASTRTFTKVVFGMFSSQKQNCSWGNLSIRIFPSTTRPFMKGHTLLRLNAKKKTWLAHVWCTLGTHSCMCEWSLRMRPKSTNFPAAFWKALLKGAVRRGTENFFSNAWMRTRRSTQLLSSLCYKQTHYWPTDPLYLKFFWLSRNVSHHRRTCKRWLT